MNRLVCRALDPLWMCVDVVVDVRSMFGHPCPTSQGFQVEEQRSDVVYQCIISFPMSISSSWRSGNLLCAGVFIMRAGEFCAGRPERPPVSQDRRQTTRFQVDEEISIEEKLMGLAPMSTKPKKKMLNVDCNAQPLDLVGVCCRF